MKPCPNCGYRHADKDYAPELMGLRLQNRPRDVVLRLSQAQGGWVTATSLIDFLYGDDMDGGPKDARGCVQSHISDVRRQIKPLGWVIEGERYRGYRLVKAPKPTGRHPRAVQWANSGRIAP